MKANRRAWTWLAALAVATPAFSQPVEPAADVPPTLRERILAVVAELIAAPLPASAETERQLEALSEEAAQSAQQATNPGDLLEARQLNLRADYALAENARRTDRPDAATLRINQVRNNAWQTKQVVSPEAPAMGDFWLLQADLFDINRSGGTLGQRQKLAATRIENFLHDRARAERAEITPAEQEMLRDVQIALLSLYDQQGHADKVRQLVTLLTEADDLPEERKLALRRGHGYLTMIGRPLEIKLVTLSGETWSSLDQRGKVILIAFWTEAFFPPRDEPQAPSAARDIVTELINATSTSAPAPLPAPALEVLNVVVGGTTQTRDLTAALGPTIVETETDRRLSHIFAIQSVPRFVIVNTTGQVAAVGGATLIDQLNQALQPVSGEEELNPDLEGEPE